MVRRRSWINGPSNSILRFETPLKMRVIDTKQGNTLFLTRIEHRFCIVGSPSHEFIITAFYDERAELVALI